MVTVHFKLFSDVVLIGHFNTIESAIYESAPGFSRSFIKSRGPREMSLIADPMAVEIFDQFEDYLLDIGEGADIERCALAFIRENIPSNNPMTVACWARALIMGLSAREIELILSGDISEEKLDVALAINRLAA